MDNIITIGDIHLNSKTIYWTDKSSLKRNLLIEKCEERSLITITEFYSFLKSQWDNDETLTFRL
jgi:hypothetical protein